MNASNSLTQSRPLYSRNGLIALLFQPFLGEMLFLPSDLFFHSYLWLLQLYLSGHITPEIVLNITETVKIYWCISTFFKVLMICLIFQFLRASYALFTFYKISSFCDSILPSRSHEVLPYCLAFFLFCDLLAWTGIVWYQHHSILYQYHS